VTNLEGTKIAGHNEVIPKKKDLLYRKLCSGS